VQTFAYRILAMAFDEFDDLENEDTLKGKYLTFNLDGHKYGIDNQFVTEYIGVQKITPVPSIPHFINAAINLRGKVIPIIDIRLHFALAEMDYDGRTCVIVFTMGETFVGLVVDTVSEIVIIPEDTVQNTPIKNITE
jgi:purine-binding chemotaxis protein CheW